MKDCPESYPTDSRIIILGESLLLFYHSGGYDIFASGIW